ncbi:MAG: Lrp/AsnC family transcriptional regulator, partial [Patescibacteria group bacterium]|nr:Lrp/AsnC family transcriptional regulator [Patescibacteria group bacterium]
ISLTELSKKTKIPVSTLFEKLKQLENNDLIKKHTSLLNFNRMGYDVRIQLLIGSSNEKEDEKKLRFFLSNHPKINNLFRINNGFNYLIEGIFTNMAELDFFLKELKDRNVNKIKEFFILEDLKREAFMEYNALY